MISLILLVPLLISFFMTLLFLPVWIRKAKQLGLVWKDMNKFTDHKVAGSGGLMVLSSFIISMFIYVAIKTFYLKDPSHLVEVISLIAVVLMAGGIGFIDDLFGWQHGGLSRRSRLFLMIFAAIPLMAINAGRQFISLPFFGQVDLGLIYPLIFIPIGIVGATTTFNFLAGFNGLEAGQGSILLFAISIVAFFSGSTWIAFAGLCMVSALLAFLVFNISPAKVFPGDVLTYSIGALIAILSILGNFEKIAVFFFIPYIIEVILKSRGKLVKHSFGKPQKDGSITLLYEKPYGLTHVSILLLQKLRIKSTENRVVYLIWAFQIIWVIIGFIIFRKGIFV